MVTPISTANSYSAILADLLNAQNSESLAQEEVSTGKKGSDLQAFGSQTSNLVATNTVKARVDQLVEQLSAQKVKLNFQQTALTSLSTVAGDLKSTLTNALANGSGDGLMTELQAYFSQATEALNSQYGGDYLFAGGQTQTQPFTATSLANLTTQPSVASFFQNGSLTPVSRLDDSTTIQTGFQAASIGAPLMTAMQAIQVFQQSASGNFGGPLTTAQQTFIEGMIGQMNTVANGAIQTAAQGGGMQSQIDTAYTAQTDRQTTLKVMLGDITDVNMAEAAAKLAQAQTAVQASAQVFTTLKGMSLLNYLSPTG